MKKVIYLSLLILSLHSCLRLDSNLYNNAKIDAYKWDGYYGAVDFFLPESYKIPPIYMNELTLISNDTVSDTKYIIKGLYIGNMGTINQDTVILYLHGNRDHMDFYWPRAKLLANVGSKNRFGVMMIDYRGYGLSDGDPTEEGLYEDVTAALEWLKGKGVTNERLIMYGFSLGSAPATKLVAHPRSTLIPSKLILENPIVEQYYITRYADLINTSFSCASMIALLDSMVNEIAPEMPAQIARWGGSMAEWQSNVQDIRDFINARCPGLVDGLIDCYELTGPFATTFDVSPPLAGEIKSNNLICALVTE